MAVTRKDTTPAEVLELIAAKLRAEVTGADDGTCIVVDQPEDMPEPIKSTTDGVRWTVSPATSGRFDEGLFDGGGVEQLNVDTHVIVTIHVASLNDEAGHSTSFFLDGNRGIFKLMAPVLAALAGQELYDADDVSVLAQPLIPMDWQSERTDQQSGSVSIAFRVNYDFETGG